MFGSVRAGLSYLAAQAFPRRPERNLEDFLVNRFGRQLYETFFKSYTEKVWGVPCTGISAAWGAQRIKGLSLTRAVVHAVSRAVGLVPKTAHTSLIERFLYPKFGPGQLWEEVARQVRERGGSIAMNRRVERIELSGGRVGAVAVRVGEDLDLDVAAVNHQAFEHQRAVTEGRLRLAPRARDRRRPGAALRAFEHHGAVDLPRTVGVDGRCLGARPVGVVRTIRQCSGSSWRQDGTHEGPPWGCAAVGRSNSGIEDQGR